MISEHIVMGWETLSRDTDTPLSAQMQQRMEPFEQLAFGYHLLKIAKTPFHCRVEHGPNECKFEMILSSSKDTLFKNLCWFGVEGIAGAPDWYEHEEVVKRVDALFAWRVDNLRMYGLMPEFPTTPEWLYSMPTFDDRDGWSLTQCMDMAFAVFCALRKARVRIDPAYRYVKNVVPPRNWRKRAKKEHLQEEVGTYPPPLTTPAQYARLCGVSRQAIYQRIRSGNLTTVLWGQPNGTRINAIDTSAYPPARAKPGPKRTNSIKIK